MALLLLGIYLKHTLTVLTSDKKRSSSDAGSAY
jgi:hypothetical protein